MEELLGGRVPGEADQVTRFTAETVAARQARVVAWVLIAVGVGCILFGGIFFEVKHIGHNVVATVTHEGPCSNGTCTVDVVYDTADGQVPAVMYGVNSDEVYGPPSHRLLNITYQSGDETNPTTNDMPDAIWIGFGAAGLAFTGFGAWWLRRKASPRMLTRAAASGAAASGAAASAAGAAALTPALAGQPGGPRWVEDRSGAITIAERSQRWQAVFLPLAAALIAGSVFAQPSRTWLARGYVLATVAYLVIAAALLVWSCSRAWRIALQLGEGGITVRNFYRTYRISWPEVSCFADGSVTRGRGWACVGSGCRAARRARSHCLRDSKRETECPTGDAGHDQASR
jgi:hypothetical protein